MEYGYGTLAHTAGKLPLKELVATLAGTGIDFVQLAMSKAISDIDTSLGKLSPGLACYVAEQFDRVGIRIGVMGCYINPVHPDPEQRRREIDRFKEHIRFARFAGAPMVATETGAYTTFKEQEPERYVEKAWELFRAFVQEVTEEAEKWGVYVGLEPVHKDNLSTPDKMLQIMEEVPSSTIGVVLDPCNLLNMENYTRQTEIVDRCFELFGDRLILIHLKDLAVDGDKLVYTKMGTGIFNHAYFLDKLKHYKPHIDISMEGTKLHEIPETMAYLKSLA